HQRTGSRNCYVTMCRDERPGLSVLASYDLLEKQETTRAGQRAYWKLKDPEGVRRALQELGVRG
ncbi:MAG: hypothetical protein ABEJ72_06100, partial [Candidatus Aenigmatarchaeota archaeon]